jgi:small-conductance mechanosensitive channel
MSLARDDVGISGALNALQTEFIKAGTLEKQENTKKVSGDQKEEPEIKDVFEKKSNNNEEKNLEQLQEDFNSLAIKDKALKEIDASLERIENSGQVPEDSESFNKSLEEVDKVIEKIAPTVTETAKPPEVKNDTTQQNTEKQNNESTENREESIKKINELRSKVSEKQQQIAELQKKMYHEVSSLVELRIGANADSPETAKQQAEELKSSVINDIKENPEQSQKIQITNFNKDLILAMLSLRR